MDPGYYQVTVYAMDASNNRSASASANVTLVLADLSQVRVYPNPWRSDKPAHLSHPWVTFDNMPLGATVKIFTASGREVKKMTPAVNSVQWDLANESGDKVASGVYLYLITVGDTGYGGDGQKLRGKLAIIK